jgi:saccharopine dehydrogenase-like NADP-dependent oxidoreductase
LKQVLLFGAGKSATVLIDYLLKNAEAEQWRLTVVDADADLARKKIGDSAHASVASFDIHDAETRAGHIAKSDIVISLLPPALHSLVAVDCVSKNKNLLTASYMDAQIVNLKAEIDRRGLLFLCEMGLDPGIDHMSAMKMIEAIRENGGEIISFHSHCGGLVAPESDDNPWRYKISWNPRSVVLAGKAGAQYRENGKNIDLHYEELFIPDRIIEIAGLGLLSWYPNRDSLSYATLYGLEHADSFVRTTLRYPDFMYGWKNVIDLKLTDEATQYDTNGKTLQAIFREHMEKNGFGEWLEKKLSDRFSETRKMLNNLVKLMEAEKEAKEGDAEVPEEFMTVDNHGNLAEIGLEDVKNRAASFMAYKMHEANLTLKQLLYLGLDDNETLVNKGLCSPADLMQFALEKKLALQPNDKDMIVMLHEIRYKKGLQEFGTNSLLVVKGEDNVHTAMAKTVGLPLGIAAKLILNGSIQLKGLHIPTNKEIYDPVLKELERHDIKFFDKEFENPATS